MDKEFIMKTSILCFGDSNTYGYDPETAGRYSEEIRWPKVLGMLLGDEYEIFEEGQNGRTIANADPWEGGTKCGMDYVLPMLETKRPDILIIMLGSNDLKAKFHLPAADIAGSLQNMLMRIKAYNERFLACPQMKILIISPPAISEPFEESRFFSFFGEDAVRRSKEMADWYKLVAEQYGYDFLNATDIIGGGSVDHLHLDPSGHRKLAQIVKTKIEEMVQK